MKWRKWSKRSFAVLLAFCLFSMSFFSSVPVVADDKDAYSNMSAEEKQIYLEKQLSEANAKLDELGNESKETKEYLDALNQKISYLNKQLNIIKDKVSDSENKITNLNKQYEKNGADILRMDTEIADMEVEIQQLSVRFDVSYELYCQRLRAMYISGETSILAFLLTSSDISQLLTRYEMVRRVAKEDSKLLASIREEGETLLKMKDDMTQRQIQLSQKQTELLQTEEEITSTLHRLEEDSQVMEAKEEILGNQQSEANRLMKKISKQTKEYTEYRDMTQAEIDEIDKEIAAAAEKYLNSTTTTTTTTTTKPSSTKPGSGEESSTTTTTKPSPSKYIQMINPISGKFSISATFPSYSNGNYHSGLDFSCASGSKVVAAESGTVIVSADKIGSNGEYISYGRYVVIAHDKKTASGNNVFTLYAHNSQRIAKVGQYVEKGQLIAYSGNTGYSTGPHLHFEVRTPSSLYADCVNPANYLP